MDPDTRMVEHLKLIQGVVSRMAANSAQMKTWAVSLVSAAFVFSGLSKEAHWLIAMGACIAVVALWIMDARYLHLERCYVKLYEAAAKNDAGSPFDLNYRPYANVVDPVWRVALSWSVGTFYGALFVMALLLLAILER